MLGEFELIRRYFTPSAFPAQVITGVGDDCAVLRLPPGCDMAISVDTQVCGVHFPAEADAASLASRVLRCAASDLAAMGAEPLGFTLALTLPQADEQWLQAFASGLQQAAADLRCPLVGGDTTKGPLTLSVQVHGSVPAGAALLRSGAQPGDEVWVSGTLGDGAAALALLQGRLAVDAAAGAYLHSRFYQPAIDFPLALALRGMAHSCIDVSDGLLADLGHICHASGVAARIRQADLPLSAHWRAAAGETQALQWALAGGDDYRLCFTAAPQHHAALQALGASCIGGISAGSGIVVVDARGVPCEITATGFRHF